MPILMRVSDTRFAAMLERWMAGESYQTIANAFGLSRQRVQQFFKPHKLIRAQVMERAQGKCEACQAWLGKAEIHHKRRIANNFNDLSNLELLCVPCHMRRHNEERIVAEAKLPLSERQVELLQHLANGSSTKQAAEALGITKHTAKQHLRRLFDRTGSHTLPQAIAVAVRTGILK